MLFFTRLLCLVAFSVTNVFGSKGYTERDLKRELFADYDKTVRPASHPNNTITVATNLSPLMIRELDEKTQILVMDTWMVMEWKDEFLKWDPSEFNNITTLNLPNTIVWKPDLSVLTAASEDAVIPTDRTNVVVQHDGFVRWVSFFTIKSRCPSPMRQANNKYKCVVRIGSWTYQGKYLNLITTDDIADLSKYERSPNWILDAAFPQRKSIFISGEEKAEMHFHVILEKRSAVPVYN